jgi:polyhydroxybutyrate depolymerase
MRVFTFWLVGCLISSTGFAESGSVPLAIVAEGLTRQAFVHIPDKLSSTSPPVVLVFHGGVRDAASAERSLGWDALADREGFLVVYPQGLPRRGQKGHTDKHLFWNSSESRFTSTADDVAFTSRLLDALTTVHAYDAKRVYATGFSNGAHMAYRLACRLSDRITAIAAVSGSLETAPCTPEVPVPLLDIHGTDDPFVKFNGGGLLGFHAVPWTRASWAAINHCDPVPITEELRPEVDDGTRVTVARYTGCAADATIETVTIFGGGHQWPGTPNEYPYLYGERMPNPFVWKVQSNLLGRNSGNFSTTQNIWNFLKQFRH